MIKLKLILLAKILFLTIMFSSGAISQTPRANDLILKFEGLKDKHLSLLNVTFTADKHVETQPLTFESISTQIMEGDEAKITVNVGRKASNRVAEYFHNWVYSWEHTVFGTTPNSLNFVVVGTLAFTAMNQAGQIKEYVYPDFVIAQGHSWGANNWWIGSRMCSWMRLSAQRTLFSADKVSRSLLCDEGEMPTQFLRLKSHHNHIKVILQNEPTVITR